MSRTRAGVWVNGVNRTDRVGEEWRRALGDINFEPMGTAEVTLVEGTDLVDITTTMGPERNEAGDFDDWWLTHDYPAENVTLRVSLQELLAAVGHA